MEYLPLRRKVWSVLFMASGFEDIAHFIIPIDYHVKRSKKEQNNLPKNQNFKFHYSLNNFVRDPPPSGVYMNCREQIWCVVSEKMSFETYPHMVPC